MKDTAAFSSVAGLAEAGRGGVGDPTYRVFRVGSVLLSVACRDYDYDNDYDYEEENT